jgi:hypothetical protein
VTEKGRYISSELKIRPSTRGKKSYGLFGNKSHHSSFPFIPKERTILKKYACSSIIRKIHMLITKTQWR